MDSRTSSLNIQLLFAQHVDRTAGVKATDDDLRYFQRESALRCREREETD